MNVNMKGFVLLVLGIGLLHTASAVTHSLRYFYTATTGIPDFPEFVDVGVVNGKVISYYDSIIKRKVPKQSWMEENLNQQYWNQGTDQLKGTEQSFKANIQVAQTRFNQTGGVHIFQYMYGCTWDDDSGVTDGLRQYGYDGEDFLVYDMKAFTWIAPKLQAEITTRKWNNEPAQMEYLKSYITQECVEWLKKYVDYGKNTLMRTVPPSVSLLQKSPSSPVTCHATGFYPSGVMVFWQKDGQDQHEDVEYGETLPNHDGTFQKSSHLTVTPEDRKNNKYQCVVQVTGIKDDFIKVLTDLDDPTPNIVPIIVVVVALLLVVVAVVVGVVIWKKKSKKGFVPASTSDTDSENSGKGAQKI